MPDYPKFKTGRNSKIIRFVGYGTILSFGLFYFSGCSASVVPHGEDQMSPSLQSALSDISTQTGGEAPSSMDYSSYVSLTGQLVAGIEKETNRKALVVDCTGRHDYQTIQQAIDAALDSVHIVIVLPSDACSGGAYFENINLQGKSLIVQSLLPTNPQLVSATIIDGDSRGDVVTFASDIKTRISSSDSTTKHAELKGLTMTHGSGSGIRIVDSSPQVSFCVIKENKNTGDGGGIRCEGKAARPAFFNCVISGNTAVNGGGMASVQNCQPAIYSSVLTQNESSFSGGGVYCQSSGLLIQNCTITWNRSGGLGGAMMFMDAPASHIDSTVVWDNESPSSSGLVVVGGKSNVTITYSDIQQDPPQLDLGPGVGMNLGTPAKIVWGEGNTSADPLLEGDGVHLSVQSPLRGAGNPNLGPQNLGTFMDIDGELRSPADRVDIGADEFGGSPM